MIEKTLEIIAQELKVQPGSQGPAGSQGPQGSPGATGATGLAGAASTVPGPQGLPGPNQILAGDLYYNPGNVVNITGSGGVLQVTLLLPVIQVILQ